MRVLPSGHRAPAGERPNSVKIMKALRSLPSEEVGAGTYVVPTNLEPLGPAPERNAAALLTVPEVAALLHVPPSWVYDHVRHGYK